MTSSPRYFFVHIQKTAGTSLVKRLKRHFAEPAVYPNTSDGDIVTCVISVEHLLTRWDERGDEIELVTGHFPACTPELLPGEFRTFTVLREPVARTLSYLRHHRAMTPADRELPLEAIYDDPFRFQGLVHNHMVKMFSLTPHDMSAGALTRVDFTSRNLDAAKQRLRTIDVVGLQEDFERFCTELSGRFGWELGEPLHANRTDPADVSDALLARIADDNALDVELYEFARELQTQRG